MKKGARLCHLLTGVHRVCQMPYYAVRRGKNPGIYSDWDSCKQEVSGFSGARYKKFSTEAEAQAFVDGSDSGPSGSYMYSGNCGASNVQGHGSRFHNSNFEFRNNRPSSNNVTLWNKSESVSGGALPSESLTTTMRTIKKGIRKLNSQVHGLQNQLINNKKNSVQKRSYCDKSDSRPSKRQKQGSSDYSEDGVFTGQSFSRSDACVYTDGSCRDNGQYGAYAGIGVYWGPNHHSNVSEPLPGRQTNNRAEIHAARKAVQQAKEKGIVNLTLKTDSRFLIDSITSWMPKWKRNGWTLSTGKPVINREDFEQLDKELQGINVKWVHTRGHTGNKGNEAADRLANEGALKHR